MILTPTPIAGVAIIDLEPRQDDRGFFARSFDREEFVRAGLNPHVEQANISFNHRAGTLRGMHFQVAPHPESKLIRCTRGAIVDTIVDMRWGSPTRLQHVSVELTADNRRALFVPAYFAHGYQTLVDETEVTYMVSGAYAPGAERGLRHDDPALGLSWPLPVADASTKDLSWPLLESWSPQELAAVSGDTT
ncbi:dTDP-4-dehydrorhamnose 3,5-epimerase family protein [Microbacterium sp. zg.Y625]|uniref:dTDP-4-dehydrorhamnose 3,5-epimerase family protein n=1 Tax=Microbacterium jiangjiandongii TaxID=3049071 RepID=UPI00214CF2C5|nr:MULTISPECIES: dTDP-4-dehydrorhamnose 3,5-epimerase family protein [unclassified Microbacterium]MCR2794075.1 dTDP-4-dehydrorhamnose 3,5-epimerase family protein [Microbacterium sp. zg.Y625]WIM25719.1 dTDP-4-dehydrorhamnose 3,5-epimerase family protein [Microbacterium sp. zg-Y625]